MAHGDYNCCACCDTKMAYSYDATTKEDLCTGCMRDLHATGVMVYSGGELEEWMRNGEDTPERKLQILRKAGFSTCYYTNSVDEAYKRLKEQTTND